MADSAVGGLRAATSRLQAAAGSLQAAAEDPESRAAALAAAGGAATIGTLGATWGTATGAIAGTALGLPLALPTCGLSLLAGSMIGATTGCTVGAAAGASVGGVAGHTAYKRRDDIREGASSAAKSAADRTSIASARTGSAVRSAVETISRLVSPPKGNRAAAGRAVWFDGSTAEAPVLLAQKVVDADGRATVLRERTGPRGDAVVVFLRHLGCAYCWSHAREWSEADVLARVKGLGLEGPLLVAPGTPEKLRRFLELNPTVPKDSVFVDPSPGFDSYRALGFSNMQFGRLPEAGTLRPKSPGLDVWSYFMYMANVLSLTPDPAPGARVPEGTLVLGGTFALRGGQVAYAWADRVPGDYPLPAEVLDAASAPVAA